MWFAPMIISDLLFDPATGKLHDSWFMLLIVSIMASVTFLLGVLSALSWKKLARVYPECPFTVDLSYKTVGSRTNKMVCLDVGEDGIRISQPRAFRFVCAPIVIPWSSVIGCRRKRQWFHHDYLEFEVKNYAATIYIGPFLWRYGDAVSKIESYWKAYQKNLPADPISLPVSR